MSALFPAIPAERDDPLGRVYTPPKLAAAIVADIDVRFRAVFGRAPRVCVDPAVGGGAFARAMRAAWPDARIVVLDIDPNAPGLDDDFEAEVGDWLCRPWLPFGVDGSIDVIATNTAWTRGTGRAGKQGEIQESVIGKHIQAALHRVPLLCSLLFPAATLWSGPEAEPREALDARPPSRVTRIDGRPWPQLRECAAYEWQRADPRWPLSDVDGVRSFEGTFVPRDPIRWVRSDGRCEKLSKRQRELTPDVKLCSCGCRDVVARQLEIGGSNAGRPREYVNDAHRAKAYRDRARAFFSDPRVRAVLASVDGFGVSERKQGPRKLATRAINFRASVNGAWLPRHWWGPLGAGRAR